MWYRVTRYWRKYTCGMMELGTGISISMVLYSYIGTAIIINVVGIICTSNGISTVLYYKY